ncbi:MAG: flagellar motor switch protein FliM [Fimbriimonadaceae bacterium]|nr:flagellar motor switch protein FliM [Fimbriimonadaceae bacterium]QYK57126.1 MAG: flagellar motor switch protein FliM [Fimbriimonadaceae bacterium]
MSEILSQAEIEALLTSLSPDSGGGASAQPEQSGGKPGASSASVRSLRAATAYEVYDFRRPDKFSKDQLRTLQMLHETFARLAGSSLSGHLRTHVSVDLISLEQVPYEEYLRSINQSVFAVMNISPLNGQAVLEIEFSIVFTMIDRLLGGPGRMIARQSITEIEQPLVRQTIERMFGALKSAWEGVVVINPSIEAIETSAQFVQIAPPSDVVISVLFEIRVGDTRGAMSLCIPYMVLKPITVKLSAQKWFASSNRKQAPAYRSTLTGHVAASNVECTATLGKCRMQVREFLQLKAGDMLRLDRRADREVLMMVAKKPKFEGRPALHNKKLVFRISQPFAEL